MICMTTTKEIPCAYCKGKGRHQGSLLSCLVCGARGKVVVEEPTKVCPACQGAGKEPGHILACFKCGGKGVRERKRNIIVSRPKPKAVLKVLKKKQSRPKCLPLVPTNIPPKETKKRKQRKKKHQKKQKKLLKKEVSLWQKFRNMLK